MDTSNHHRMTRVVDQTFFEADLTGKGKSRSGVLRAGVGVRSASFGLTPALDAPPITDKKRYSNGGVITRLVPVTPMLKSTTTTRRAVRVARPAHTLTIDEYEISLEPAWFMLRTGAKVADTVLQITYKLGLHHVVDDTDRTSWTGDVPGRNQVRLAWTRRPDMSIRTMLDEADVVLDTVTNERIDAWLDAYVLHEQFSEQARIWTSKKIADLVCDFIVDVADHVTHDEQVRSVLGDQLAYLATYDVSIEDYLAIFATMKQILPEQVADALAQTNVNLSVARALGRLEQHRHEATRLTTIRERSDALAQFSDQQRAAILSEEPYVLVIAGAGTGKSTMVTGRIEHLVANGVAIESIMATSFTNAAAEVLAERYPGLNSITLDSMALEIYAHNYPAQKLSDVDTMVNSMNIMFRTSSIAAGLAHHLQMTQSNSLRSFADLYRFVEENYDDVVTILDTIGQTSLTLQLVMCSLRLELMIEPEHMMCDYLIIDESQDCSVPQFAFAMAYALKHHCNLFMVGDPSQVLYEFRASNPRALTALEASGVFATYPLTLNFRSTQPILDVANEQLKTIEANAYSKINLTAYERTPHTREFFDASVVCVSDELDRWNQMPDSITTAIAHHGRTMIESALLRGEQITVLAPYRQHLEIVDKTLRTLYPDATIVSLVPDRPEASVAFSRFVREHWTQVEQVSPRDAVTVFQMQLFACLTSLIPAGSNENVVEMVHDLVENWLANNIVAIEDWLDRWSNQTMTTQDFFNRLRTSIIEHEVNLNADRLRAVKTRNREVKDTLDNTGAHFILSTIHSAKGLEFENVILVNRYTQQVPEADKRLYYVGVTRARRRLLVAAHGITGSLAAPVPQAVSTARESYPIT